MGNRDIDFGPSGWKSNGDWKSTVIAASAAAKTLDASDVTDITLTANCTITLPPAMVGQKLRLIVRQDGTGSRTVTWTSVKWAGGTAPTLSTPAGSVDRIDVECPDGVSWFGTVPGKAFA